MKRHPTLPYFVRPDGAIFYQGKRQTTYIKDTGYEVFNSRGSNRTILRVHSLLLETYIGPCPPDYECRHLNGIRSDNRLANLTWGTKSRNQQDRVAHGTDCRGEKHGAVTINDHEAMVIKCKLRSGKYQDTELAQQMGIPVHVVRHIKRGNTFNHIN